MNCDNSEHQEKQLAKDIRSLIESANEKIEQLARMGVSTEVRVEQMLLLGRSDYVNISVRISKNI